MWIISFLWNTGSPAFAGDDTKRGHSPALPWASKPRSSCPAVIPAKAGIQYAAASRSIISSSAILDRPPSRAMTRSVDIRLRSHAQRGRFCLSPAPIVIPAKAGHPVRRGPSDRSLSSSAILDRPPSRAMTRRVDIRMRSHAQRAAFARPPNRHTRESGYDVRRGPSIDHRLLCNTGSPAFVGDHTAVTGSTGAGGIPPASIASPAIRQRSSRNRPATT